MLSPKKKVLLPHKKKNIEVFKHIGYICKGSKCVKHALILKRKNMLHRSGVQERKEKVQKVISLSKYGRKSIKGIQVPSEEMENYVLEKVSNNLLHATIFCLSNPVAFLCIKA